MSSSGATFNAVVLSFKAGAAITRDHAVILSADNTVIMASADNQDIIGFADFEIDGTGDNYDDVCPVHVSGGKRTVVADGAVTRGDKLIAANGGGVKTMPTAAGTYYTVGIALKSAADEKKFEMLMRNRVVVVTA